jgi:esterase/lipase superfamily enzyme
MVAYRFIHVLSFIIAVILDAAVGQAQPSRERPIPEACHASSGEALPALEKRKQTLEQDIAQSAAAPTGPEHKQLGDSLRKSREDLLDVLFRMECVRAASEALATPPSPQQRRTRALSAPKPHEVIEVTTYYATNRKPSGNAEPVKVYGSEVEGGLHYGRAIVTIPPTHTPGNLELPTLWKLEREPDPSKHFVLKSVMPLKADAARKEMTEKLQGLASKALLIFVHGYNMGFVEAALRTAQLAHDLKFPGMAFFYSWPSANSVRAYWQDEETARLSEGVFEQLIEELSQLPVTDIYLVAHSMGNRIVGHALQSRMDKGKETKHLREVLLAAPDISADIFRTVIAPKLAAMQGTRTTVYASSSDIALKVSKVVHGFRRAGETTGGVFTYPGLETIDASSAAAMTRGYGHLYVMDSPSVVKDILAIIEKKGSAKLRGLSEAGASPNTYWRLP